MRKYDPLLNYLRRQKAEEIEMTFGEIERRIGALLPNGARSPKWWANNEARGAQASSWLNAGYDAVLETGLDRVRFKRRARAQRAS